MFCSMSCPNFGPDVPLGHCGGDARVLDHCVLLGESLWFQPASQLVSGHPWRPRIHHRFTTDPVRTGGGERGGSLCRWRVLARAVTAPHGRGGLGGAEGQERRDQKSR